MLESMNDVSPKQKAQPPKDQRRDRNGQQEQPGTSDERRSQRPKYLEDVRQQLLCMCTGVQWLTFVSSVLSLTMALSC